MYNVVLVEDDSLSLTALKRLIENSFEEFTVIGAFTSPKDAIEFMETNTADIIITDIVMPEISGIELAEAILTKYPFIKIVLLSAYRDFDIACRALNSNIVSYILKPLTLEKLSLSLEKAKKGINKAEKKFAFSSKSTMQKNASLIEKVLNREIVSEEEILEAFDKSEININIKSSKCVLFRCEIIDYTSYIKNVWKHNKENLNIAINNILTNFNTASFFGITYDWCDNYFSFFCFVSDNLFKNIDSMISQLQYNLSSNLKINIEFKFLSKFDSILSTANDAPANDAEERLLDKILNPDKTFVLTDETLEETVNNYGIFSEKLASAIAKQIDSSAFENAGINIYSYVNCETKSDFQAFIIQISNAIQPIKSQNSKTELYNKTLNYIKENYMTQITLDEISSHIGFSTWFFCKFFKKHSGMNFVDYLNSYRISKAIEMLDKDPDIKISFLCYHVGYQTSSNFYKNFKHYTGITPREYAQKKGRTK